MTGKITVARLGLSRPRPTRGLAILCGLLLASTIACGQPVADGEADDPTSAKAVACTLQWTGPADLDLTVDEVSVARIGGSPDATQGGGSESITISEDDTRETVVVGIANRSAEPGGSGLVEARATLTLTRHDGSTVTFDHSMDTSPWPAAIVHTKSGIVVPVP